MLRLICTGSGLWVDKEYIMLYVQNCYKTIYNSHTSLQSMKWTSLLPFNLRKYLEFEIFENVEFRIGTNDQNDLIDKMSKC